MGNKGCKKEEMAFQKDDKCAEVVHLLKGVQYMYMTRVYDYVFFGDDDAIYIRFQFRQQKQNPLRCKT